MARRETEAIKSLSSSSLGNSPFVAGHEYSVVADSNSVIRIKVDKPIRGVLVTESPIFCTASVHFVRSGYAYIRLTRPWELIAHEEVLTTVSSFDFDAILNTLDTEVKLTGYWSASSGSPGLFWRLNTDNSLGGSEKLQQGTIGTTGISGLQVAEADNSEATEVKLTSDLSLELGSPRMGNSTTAESNTALRFFSYAYDNTDNEITKLGLQATGFDGIVAGSHFSLYRKPQFNKTKLKLWVY